jgi:hypothetical protein
MILTGLNCLTDRLGTGMENCQVVEGQANGFILVPKGWSLNKESGTFDLAYVQNQIQLKNFIPFIGCFNSAPETPEATTEESSQGLLSVVRQGKPQYVFTYKKGFAFHRTAYSYNSDSAYDVLITYESGAIRVGTNKARTVIKGLDLGMLNTDGYMENNGTESASTTTRFQLTDPSEYNNYSEFLLGGLDFNPATEVNGIVDVILKGTADSGANTVTVKATWLGNETFFVNGFTAPNFRLTIDGVADTIVSVTSAGGGEYVITPTASLADGEIVVVQLFDATVPTAVAKLGNKFYQGATAGIEVTSISV